MATYKAMTEETFDDEAIPFNYAEASENMWDAINVHPKAKPHTNGWEVPDPTPMEPPLGYVRTEPLAVQIRNQVILAKKLAEAEAAGDDTFEEADDFDVGDDYDPESPYETDFDPMSPEDKAALASEGRDVDRSLSPEQKKNLRTATSSPSVTKAAQPPKSGQPEVDTRAGEDTTGD